MIMDINGLLREDTASHIGSETRECEKKVFTQLATSCRLIVITQACQGWGEALEYTKTWTTIVVSKANPSPFIMKYDA